MQSGDIEDPTAAVERIVTAKVRRAAGYDWRGATQRWLIISAESEGLADSGFFMREPATQLRETESPFTHVFFHELAVR
jgi:hypothetical protein